MEELLDTIKTSSVGIATIQVTCWDILPDVISICVGVATFVYLIIKIRNEIWVKK